MKAKSKKNAPARRGPRNKVEAAVLEFKKKMGLEALKRHGDLEKAAQSLGMTGAGLQQMLLKLGVRVRIKLTPSLEIIEPKR